MNFSQQISGMKTNINNCQQEIIKNNNWGFLCAGHSYLPSLGMNVNRHVSAPSIQTHKHNHILTKYAVQPD